jgi:subfamily B ATP-binding cassette protein MsbA
MNTYFRLLSFAKPIEKYAIPYIICVVFTVFFSTLNLALLAPLLTTLFNADTNAELLTKPEEWTDILGYFNYYAQQAFLKFGTFGALKRVCTVIIFSVLFSNLFRYLSQRIMENLKIHTLLNLRRTAFNRVMDMHVGYFNNQRKGDIISKIASDVQVVQFSVTGTLQVVFKEPLQLIAYFAMLFFISVKLTIFAILVIPVSAFFISRIVKKLKAQATEAQEVYGNMISFLDEALSGVKIIKAFNATEFIKSRFNRENEHFSKIGRRMVRRQQLGSPVSEFLGVIMVTIIVLYGGYLVINEDSALDATKFIAYIAIFSQVMRPAKALTDSFSNINSGIAAGERVLELIDNRPTIIDKADAKEIYTFNESIKFSNIHFSYNEEKEVLSDINITIPKGKMVALVGPSGGGKSTLMDLLPRFIDPSSGQLFIDGEDIRNIKIDSLRSLMGTVNQELILFNDTIFNNISFGIEASEEEVETAAKIANAHDFILETEHGYQTNIGDRGAKLSGGQKQRLCIARAILRNPPILLLDEATSALDTESEKLVQSALNNLMKNRTSLVIAHRLSTIQQADHIYVLDGGRIVQDGTHTQLMGKAGLYRKLIEMQQFDQREEIN